MMRILLTLLISSTFVCANSYAQDVTGSSRPGAIQTRSQETFQYYDLKEKIQQKAPEIEDTVVDETQRPTEEAPAEEKKLILVEEFDVSPSAILSDEEIKNITRPFIGQQASLKDLFGVVEQINQIYKKKNYTTAVAILPPQKIKDGVVRIKLIEGRIGKILIEGNKSTRRSFIENWIDSKSGDLIRLDDLEQDLLYFNSINDVKIRAVLKPGEEFGTTDFSLKAEEPKQWEMLIFSDNAGRDDIGLYRGGISVTNNSVLGFRDQVTIGGIFAEGTSDGYISYNFPINAKGTRVGLSYDYSKIKIISGSLESLDIDGHSYDAAAFVTHPLKVTRTFRINGFLGINAKKSVTEFANFASQETEVRSLSFGIDHQSFDPHGTWYGRHNIVEGFNHFNGDKSFFKYSGDYSRLQIIKDDVYATFRGRLQLSDRDQLPSAEQFQIGGTSTVRGYEEGLLIGDNGYFISTELNVPLRIRKANTRDDLFHDKLRGIIFVDHGAVFRLQDDGGSTDNPDYLTSAGIGLVIADIKNFSARVTMSVPLKDNVNNENDGPRTHFYIQRSF